MKIHSQPCARVKSIFAISFVLLSSLAHWTNAYAQEFSNESITDSVYRPKLILDFPLIDYPYLGMAAQTTANHRLGQPAGASGNANASDYWRGYSSPSMRQATAMAKDVHTTG
jgi:hypothetical protein